MSVTVARTETPEDLAACMALRAEVFIAEQGVPEADEIDGLDGQAVHLLARSDGRPAGTLRLRRLGEAAKIERVCVAQPLRGLGIAARLTEVALAEISGWGGIAEIRLSAQVPVIGFYERFGFIAEGPVYDDAGLPHRDMRRAP